MTNKYDIVGNFLKKCPPLWSTPLGYVLWRWLRSRRESDVRLLTTRRGLRFELHLSQQYEAMIWLEHEDTQDLLELEQLLKPGDVFVDVGANVGLWTIHAASATGRAGRVIAVEPNPVAYGRLLKNIRLNDFDQLVRLVAASVGRDRGRSPFYCNVRHNCSSSIPTAGSPAITVDTLPLDSIVGDVHVAGIKIDVEGAELDVLHSAKEILHRDRPWIITEFNRSFTSARALEDWPLYQYLNHLHYEAVKFGFGNRENTLRTLVRDGPHYFNVLFIHRQPAPAGAVV